MTRTAIVPDTPSKAWARALANTAAIARNPGVTFPTLITELAETFGDRPALIGEDVTYSYRALASRANQFARWALAQGVCRGDVVCLVMQNCPDYLAAWLGITRTGAVASLVNTNLVGDSLAHAIRTASPKCIVVGADLADAVAAATASLEPAMSCWVHGEEPRGHSMERIDLSLDSESPMELTASECALPSTRDRALYIYTSGTTGLPKAAVVSHHRVLQWSYWFAGMLDTNEDDRMFNCLPMYHSVGGIVAIGSTLVRGGSVVIRRKFSARAFWDDVARTECTMFQYIGELCRFLVNMPPNPRETEHHIRIACGNGLRPDIWESFQSRFAIPRILEFYAATEANFSLYNCEGKPGAIGRIPAFLAHRFPTALVAFDHLAGEPARDERGFCVRCAPHESGEALGQILDAHGGTRFEGYTDAAASSKKILRNVFAPGDAWYRTGDLMRQDEQGFFYFVDRVGDTFRWKGENVSTTEVAAVIAGCPGVAEAAVYGVSVPGAEGRAGMAALVVERDFELAGLRRALSERLPGYARPLFIRIVSAIELTGTFKLRKQELALEGYDPARVRDAIYVDDPEAGAYVALDAKLHGRLLAGTLRI